MQRNEAFSLLQDEYMCSDEAELVEARANRRSAIKDLVGDGYNMDTTGRTFRRHKALAIAQIKQIARNPLQQQQLAQAVLEHYKGGAGGAVTPDDRTEYAAHVAVIEGIVESLRMLKKRNGGRYTREDRIAQHVLLSASVLKSGNKKMQASIRRLLETSSKSIDKAVARNTDAATMERPYFFVDDEKSCNSYPAEWGTYITECWDDLTRASECTSDEARDKEADENGIHPTHRIHWINNRLDDLLLIMLALGKEHFGDEFTVSRPTMLKFKKYYHRYPGRNTCLCRYHMEFDNHFYAIRRWKASVQRSSCRNA
jgi:hypothetical protein